MGNTFSQKAMNQHDHYVQYVHYVDPRTEEGSLIESSTNNDDDSSSDELNRISVPDACEHGERITPIAAVASSDPTLDHSQRFIELHRENNLIAEAFSDDFAWAISEHGGSILSAWLVASKKFRDAHASRKLVRFEHTASIITDEWRDSIVAASEMPLKDVAWAHYRLYNDKYLANRIKNHGLLFAPLIGKYLEQGFDLHDLTLQLERILEGVDEPESAIKPFTRMFDGLEPCARLLHLAPALRAQFPGDDPFSLSGHLIVDNDDNDDDEMPDVDDNEMPDIDDSIAAQYAQDPDDLVQEHISISSTSSPSIPSSPRPTDIQGPFSPPFNQTFDRLRTSISVLPRRRPASRYKDPRIPRVDPLRYQNRLEEPRRLPNTPTVSHQPPRPRSHTRTPEPRACAACGRAFRKRVTKSAQKSSVKKGSTAAVRIVDVDDSRRWPIRARKAPAKFGA